MHLKTLWRHFEEFKRHFAVQNRCNFMKLTCFMSKIFLERPYIIFITCINFNWLHRKGNVSSKTNSVSFYEFTYFCYVYKHNILLDFIANIIFQGKKRNILNNTPCVYLKEFFVFFSTIYFIMIVSVPRYANVHNQNT